MKNYLRFLRQSNLLQAKFLRSQRRSSLAVTGGLIAVSAVLINVSTSVGQSTATTTTSASTTAVSTAMTQATAQLSEQAVLDMKLFRYEGAVQPKLQAILKPVFDGRLYEINVVEGDQVKQGQLLGRLDDRAQSMNVKEAQLRADSEAGVERATYALEEAQMNYERAQKSFEADAASEWEVRRARVLRDQATADVQLAKDQGMINEALLELEEQRLADYRFEAPFDGEVTEVVGQPGNAVNRDDPVMTVKAFETLEAQLFLPARLYGLLKAGHAYELVASTPVDRVLIGKLRYIDPNLDSASETMRTLFEIDNAERALPAGFTVYLKSPVAVDKKVDE